jgi:hypothetical protein
MSGLGAISATGYQGIKCTPKRQNKQRFAEIDFFILKYSKGLGKNAR